MAASSGKRDVYRDVYELLRNGTYKPGDRIRESELASRIGTSRTPVREALGRLESQGLVEHAPHRGMIVCQLDDRAMTELYVMREMLEGTAAALAAQHATEVEVMAFRDMLAADREHVGDAAWLARSNVRFHQSIYRAAHNRFLVKALNALADAMALLGPTTLSVPGRGSESLQEHARLIEAIERRDPLAAGEAARAHIRSAHRARLTLLHSDAVAATGDESGG